MTFIIWCDHVAAVEPMPPPQPPSQTSEPPEPKTTPAPTKPQDPEDPTGRPPGVPATGPRRPVRVAIRPTAKPQVVR